MDSHWEMIILKKYYWAIIPIVGWLIVKFGFDFNGLYGQDAYAYLLHSREWKAFFIGGAIPSSFYWPPNYSIVSALLAFIVGTEFVSLQLISVLSMAGLAYVLDSWFRKEYDLEKDTRIAFITLAFLLSPYMFRLGQQSISEMLTMVFITGSFYHLKQYLQHEKVRSLLLWSVTAALSITTRYPAVIVLIAPILFMGFRLIRKGQFTRLLAGTIVGLVPVLVAVWWKTKSGGMEQVMSADLLQNWSVSQLFQTEFSRDEGNFSFMFPNILFNLSALVHPGTVFFGVLLLPFAFKKLKNNTARLLAAISFLIYALFLSGVPVQNTRLMTFSYPLLVMISFPGFVELTNWIKSKRIPTTLLFTACLIVQIALCARAMQPSIVHNHFEEELANWVRENHTSKTIYTSDYPQLFDVYETGNPVVQTYTVLLNSFEDDAIFIFNQSSSEFKLKGTVPLQNWLLAQNLMQVEEEKGWSNGWCVYSLKSR
ncbi:MAG: hypothetical protein ACI9YU_000347 [Flavobacteriales bacterium]|jgi:hypothetical protein